MRYLRLLTFSSLLLLSSLYGESTLSSNSSSFQIEEETVSGNDRFYQEFTKMLVILGGMVATLIFIAWLFKRVSNTRIDQLNVTSAIKILEKRVISPKSLVYLVEVHNHRLVIGESQNGLVLLSDITMADAAAQQTSFEEVMGNIQIKNRIQ